MMNRRGSLKLLLAASGSSILPPLWAADNQMAAPATAVSESPRNGHMEAPRELVQFGEGWRFFRSDDLVGAEAVTFDDRAWEHVTVPHTWQTLANQSNYSHC